MGAALQLLPLADPDRWPDEAAVVAEFLPAIDAGGDFEALVLALPHAGDRQATYLSRASTVTTCTFEQATALMDALAKAGNTPGFRRWSGIAASLADKDAWQMTALADRLLQYGDPAEEARAFALYEASWQQAS